MKKIFFVLCCLTAFTFSTYAQKVSEKNGRLIFGSFDDYETVLTMDPANRAKALSAFGSSVKHLSSVEFLDLLQDSVKSEETYEAALPLVEIINQSGIVEMNNYIFRIDIKNQKAFLLESANENEENMNALLNGLSNGFIKEYSLTDDVIGILQNDVEVSSARLSSIWFTGHEYKYVDDCASKEENIEVPKRYADGAMDGKISYDSYAIYFTLYGKEKYQRKNFLSQLVTINIGELTASPWYVEFDVKFKSKKRGSSWSQYTGNLNPGDGVSGSKNECKRTFYARMRGLSSGSYLKWNVQNKNVRWAQIHRGTNEWNNQFRFEIYNNTGCILTPNFRTDSDRLQMYL